MAGDTRLGLLATLREIWCKLGQWCQKISPCVSLSAVAASLVRPSPTSSVALGPDPSSSRAPESLARRRGSPAAFWRWIGAMVRRSNNWHVAASSCTPSWLRKLVATGATAEWSPIPAQRPNTTSARRATIGTSNWLAEGVALDRRLGVGRHHRPGSSSPIYRCHDACGASAGSRTAARSRHRPHRSGSVVTGVETDGGRIEGDAVVIAMGPWSIMASSWLPLPAVFGLKGTAWCLTLVQRCQPRHSSLNTEKRLAIHCRPRSFHAVTAPHTSAPFPARVHFRLIPVALPRTRVRSNVWKS